tara:strand:+ start:586 stop:1713 length:1128 start_codon:yes stop_codon:yes gene_type:complete
MSSSLIVEVCEIKKIKEHGNADALEIAEVKGWDCIVKKDQYKAGDVIIFIPPDSLLPIELGDRLGVREYLGGSLKNRVRLAKLRGVVSYGLIIDNEENWEVGTDVVEHYGITKYEPPVRTTAGDAEKDDIYFERYTDIENIRNYPDVFEEGEEVVITEKCDGTQSRIGRDTSIDISPLKNILYKVFGQIKELQWKAGSNKLKRKKPKNMSGNVYWYPYTLPEIRRLINHLIDEVGHKSAFIYGEIYGKVRGGLKEMTYGRQGKLGYAAFDIKVDGRFLDNHDFQLVCRQCGVEMVPHLGVTPYNFNNIQSLSTGESILASKNGAKHIREGIVIKPVKESVTEAGRRRILKMINPDYLAKKEKNYSKGEVADFSDV